MMAPTTIEVLRRLLVWQGDDESRTATLAGTCVFVDGEYQFTQVKQCMYALNAHVCCRDSESPKGGYSGVVTAYSRGEWTIQIDAGECVDGHLQTGEFELQVELNDNQDFVYLLVDEN